MLMTKMKAPAGAVRYNERSVGQGDIVNVLARDVAALEAAGWQIAEPDAEPIEETETAEKDYQ